MSGSPAGSLAEYVVNARRELHSFPEIGLHNPVTQRLIRAHLDLVPGLRVRASRNSTSLIAIQRFDRPGPTVILRADTDALPMQETSGESFASQIPGVAHSCGHDAHTAMLLGAARLLAERRAALYGRVIYVFQAGEEGFAGADLLLSEGLLDGLTGPDTWTFAIHITPNLPTGVIATRTGTLMASTDGIAVVLRGRGGHAAQPALCHSPLPAAADLTLRLTGMFSARDPSRAVSVTSIQAGTTHNVIPTTATVQLTARCLDEGDRVTTLQRIDAAVAHVATSRAVTAEVDRIVSYPCTVNAATAVDVVSKVASGVGLHCVDLTAPVMTAEDFAYFLRRWPGCMVLLGACPEEFDDPAQAPECHRPDMRLNESALMFGAELHTAFAMAICGERT
jgi:hippurate hydrolase